MSVDRASGSTDRLRLGLADADLRGLEHLSVATADLGEALAVISLWRGLCDRYGLPYDTEGLVRHLEGNARLRATADAIVDCHERNGACHFLTPTPDPTEETPCPPT